MPKPASSGASSRLESFAPSRLAFGGLWRIGLQDLEGYISDAHQRTAERIAAGDVADDGAEGD